MARPGDLAALEARADLEALGGRDGEHGVRELSLELVEDGLTESSRNVADDADDGAADRVLSSRMVLLGACLVWVPYLLRMLLGTGSVLGRA